MPDGDGHSGRLASGKSDRLGVGSRESTKIFRVTVKASRERARSWKRNVESALRWVFFRKKKLRPRRD